MYMMPFPGDDNSRPLVLFKDIILHGELLKPTTLQGKRIPTNTKCDKHSFVMDRNMA